VLAQQSIDTVEPRQPPGLCRQVFPLIIGVVLINVTFEDTLGQLSLLAFGFPIWTRCPKSAKPIGCGSRLA
jgi:hypothetical protein